MRFKGLDLNLLVALDVLLDEQSVSKAASRLHLSQPAMSAALGRLREYFKDPILKQHGKRMIPTAHALRISAELKTVLSDVESLIFKTSTFDAFNSSRQFKLIASDYVATTVLVPLLVRLEKLAPSVRFQVLTPGNNSNLLLDQGQIDLAILPKQSLLTDLPSKFLFQDGFVIVGCPSNPLFETTIGEEEFYGAPHVLVRLGGIRPMSISDLVLSERSQKRQIDIEIQSFLLAPQLVLGTRRIAVMHERLARYFSKIIPLAMAPMPFEFPKIQEYMYFHSTRTDDRGTQWLMDQLLAQISINLMNE